MLQNVTGFAAMLFAAIGLFAQASDLAPDQFAENKLDKVPVSGEQLVGIVAVPAGTLAGAPSVSLYVHVPAGIAGRIDVHTVNLAGDYVADIA
jgi:hypothetical protein